MVGVAGHRRAPGRCRMVGMTAQRLRRSWRLARREMFGAARSVRYELGRLERPGHARGRIAVEWDGSDRPYRRLVTPLVFGVLLLAAISGSYYAAGGLFRHDRSPTGTSVPVTTGSPAPLPTAVTTSSPAAVTVLPASPLPGHPTPTPQPSGDSPPGNPTSPRSACTNCPVQTSSPTPSPDPTPSPTETGSDSPSPSDSPSS